MSFKKWCKNGFHIRPEGDSISRSHCSLMKKLWKVQKNNFLNICSVNPNQSGFPDDSKGVTCWYFNTNWFWSFNTNYPMSRLWYCKKRQKRMTLRAWLRYLENSDQCIKFTSCSSFYAWSWSINWGQSLQNLTLTDHSEYCDFAAKSRDEKSTKGVACW